MSESYVNPMTEARKQATEALSVLLDVARETHGFGCPRDGALMIGNCEHCCRHGWVESAQAAPCPSCYPSAPPEPLEQQLREAATVLDEPFHHDAIAVTLLEAADALQAAKARIVELERLVVWAICAHCGGSKPAYGTCECGSPENLEDSK